MFGRIIKEELKHFRALNEKARNLLLSLFAFNIAAPILTLFANAYIWRQTPGLLSVSIFNAFWLVGVTSAFLLNGYLLGKFTLTRLYASGLFLQAAANTILFFTNQVTNPKLMILGFILGSTAGLYWSNRNIITLQVTNSEERNYFCSLEIGFGTLCGVISPFVFGWFLELGEGATDAIVLQNYRILMVVILFVQLLGAWLIVRAPFNDFTPHNIFLKHSSPSWNRVRIFTSLKGIADGSSLFLPTLMILYLVGQERALGTIQSLAVLFNTIVLYFVARWMTTNRRYAVLSAGVALLVSAGTVISIWFIPISGIIYLIVQNLGVQLIWSAANPMIMDAINLNRTKDEESYSYILDREIHLNLGRISGILLTMAGIFVIGEGTCLRMMPVVLAVLTSLILVCGKSLAIAPHPDAVHSLI